jgi:hypothetical protein
LPRSPGSVTVGTGVGLGDGLEGIYDFDEFLSPMALGLEASATPAPMTTARTGSARNFNHRVAAGLKPLLTAGGF